MTSEAKPAAMRESRDIEWLLDWGLRRQMATASMPIDVISSGGGLPDWLVLGTRIDKSMKGGAIGGVGGPIVHEDAQIIADALGQLCRNPASRLAGGLVATHARAGTQPDWGRDGCGRWVLQRRNNGQGKAIRRYDDPKRQRGLLGFEWKFVGHSVESLERMMLEWLAWHAALAELVTMINPRMHQYVATGPRWPEEPWNDPRHTRLIGGLGELEADDAGAVG